MPGTYVYTPGIPTVLPVRTNPLSVTFTPTNPAAYTTVTGTNSILVTQATPILNWPTPAAIAVGNCAGQHPTRCHCNLPGCDSSRELLLTLYYRLTLRRRARCWLLPERGQLQVEGKPAGNTTDFTTATATVQIVVGATGSHGGQRIGLVPQRRLLLLQPTHPLCHNGIGIYSRSDRNRECSLQWSNYREQSALRNRIGHEFDCNLNLMSSYFSPWKQTVTMNYLGDNNYVPNSNSAVVPLRDPAIGADPATVNSGTSTIQVPYAFPGGSHDLQLQPWQAGNL